MGPDAPQVFTPPPVEKDSLLKKYRLPLIIGSVLIVVLMAGVVFVMAKNSSRQKEVGEETPVAITEEEDSTEIPANENMHEETDKPEPEPATANPTPTTPKPGSTTPKPSPDPTPDPTPVPQPKTHNITVENYAFGTPSLTIKAGDTVKWTNKDNDSHTVTATGGAFDSGLFGLNQTFSYKFNSTGTYTYYCAPHPSMTGTIIVNP